jgi:hypothetical protein
MTDTTLCCSSTPGEGCNGYFPNKTAPGLCGKCTALDNATSEEMKTRIDICGGLVFLVCLTYIFQSIPQCAECGALGQYIKNEKCPSCLRKGDEILALENCATHIYFREEQGLTTKCVPSSECRAHCSPQRLLGSESSTFPRPSTVNICFISFYRAFLQVFFHSAPQ